MIKELPLEGCWNDSDFAGNEDSESAHFVGNRNSEVALVCRNWNNALFRRKSEFERRTFPSEIGILKAHSLVGIRIRKAHFFCRKLELGSSSRLSELRIRNFKRKGVSEFGSGPPDTHVS